MEIIINELVSTVRLTDAQALLDQRTLATIVRTVTAAIDERDERARRRSEETRVADDGRRGISGQGAD